MHGHHKVLVPLALVTLASLGAPDLCLADTAPNSLRLDLTATHVVLTWADGTPPYGVYRSTSPQDVTDPSHLIGTTSGTSYFDRLSELPRDLYFYAVDTLAVDPTCSLAAVPDTIDLGDSSRLTWSSTNGTSATLNGQPVPLAGSLEVSPVRTTIYTLLVSGEPGTTPAECTGTVTLNPAPMCAIDQACIEWCGSGQIENFLTHGTIGLDGDDMVHVLILPEGYTASDMASGVFSNDVQDWIAEWEIIEPYDTYRDAFCIWKMPVESNEHVAPDSPQTADTAFLVPITPDGNAVDSDIPSTGPTSQRVWEVVEEFPFRPESFYPSGGRTNLIAKNLVVVILVFDEDVGRSGLSGRARRLENPFNASERVSTAFAHNRPHEFSHAFSRLQDEYIEDCCGPLCSDIDSSVLSRDLINVVCSPECGPSPWSHLFFGTPINSSTDELVGSFGVEGIGYHSEFKCLMNGTHDNATYYGGDGRLRVYDRFCNFCREVSVFRLFERVHVLDDPAVSYAIWSASYRNAFYTEFGFNVPSPVPQENSDGTPIFQECTSAFFPDSLTTEPWRVGGHFDVLCDGPED